ncbi:MAG: histidinol-phosphate transaminase [Terriglobales bacterium]|jgi:histidinol-phosphate aminotransferase
MLKARDAVRNLSEYDPPLVGREGLRLDLNENTAGCSPCVLACLRELTANEIGYYREREPMEAAVAEHLGIRADEVLLTNGVDEAIHLLFETFLEPGDEVLLVVPTFVMYEILAAATGARIVKVPAGENFCFPFSQLLAHINSRTRMIAIANPNNPTGIAADAEQLVEIARRAPDAAVLIDEAYFEFYGETLMGAWRREPGLANLFVARTFSKAYGMAGLRLGVLAGDAEYIAMARRVASPFNVNAAALACLPVALKDADYVRDYVSQVRRGREELSRELDRWGIPYWASNGNFVLAKVGPQHAVFVAAMEARGILLRDRSRDHGCEGCVRISIGTLEHTAQLIAALRATLAAMGMKQVITK